TYPSATSTAVLAVAGPVGSGHSATTPSLPLTDGTLRKAAAGSTPARELLEYIPASLPEGNRRSAQDDSPAARNWALDARAFDQTMTLVGEVYRQDRVVMDTTLLVGAFDADSLRGLGRLQYVPALDRYRVFMMVYGADGLTESLTLQLIDSGTGVAEPIEQPLRFASEARIGNLAEPLLLSVVSPEEIPVDYALHQNYPNPFNPQTQIQFGLPEASSVTLTVYDVAGRRVAMLLKEDPMEAGWHTMLFDGQNLASGVYFYRLEAGSFRKVQKMILLK
ncbi:MAG: T9SS type A sorting domain-containing protein, partial [Gemmatimonadetes bacterium]|nr:T9SS type A sorting domain-containing protein [Gemmatimonadota bacterium]